MIDLVIVTGTDPSSRKGGIGFALPGYLRALDFAGLHWSFIPTHHPLIRGGRWRLWVKAFPRLVTAICQQRSRGNQTIVYGHAGAGASLARQFFILLMSRVLGAKTILQLHALEVSDYLGSPLRKFLFRVAIAPAQSIAVLTPWWRQLLLEQGITKQMFVIPNPLPEDWERVAKVPLKRRNMNNGLRLLSMTRLEPGKGVDLVIEAAPFLTDDYQLVVAGDGPMQARLKRRIDELGLQGMVHMPGWVDGEEKQRLFEEADIFVLPSRYDSFGMGFLEAMAYGLPVVAADWGAIPDVVPHGKCGILVEEDTPHALASGVIRLQDLEKRLVMGEMAKCWVLERFSAEVVAGELYAMMQATSR